MAWQYTPLLAGMGLVQWSVPTHKIAKVSSTLQHLDTVSCEKLLQTCLHLSHAEEVEKQLYDFYQNQNLPKKPLFSEHTIVVHNKDRYKSSVIKRIAYVLQQDNRLVDADGLERDLWKREHQGSTHIGHGIAVPHCRSSVTKQSTICVLLFDQEFLWDTNDVDTKTHVVIAFVTPEHNTYQEHEKTIALLAKSLAQTKIYTSLITSTEPQQVLYLLKTILPES